MGKITENFHVVTINRELGINPNNSLKIDGKQIHGITNVKIEYGLKEPYPLINIEFMAKKLTAQIKSKNIKKTRSE